MKKLLGISLVAMMAVTTARADIASKAYVDQQDGQLSTLRTTAKNNLVAAINELSDKTGTGNVAEQIAEALEAYTETGEDTNYVSTVTSSGDGNVVSAVSANNNGTVTVTKGITALQQSDVAQTYSATGTAPVSGTAVASAISAAQTDLQSDIDSKVDANTAITAGTHTKITYDAKGLVTAGADLAEADIPALSISKTTGLQAALDAKEDASNKVTAMTAQSTDAQYPSAKAVYDAVEGAKTASTNAISALDMVAADTTGTGNVVTSVNQVDGKVTAEKGITAIPAPTADCANPTNKCVLTSAGSGNYAWEVIARGTGE